MTSAAKSPYAGYRFPGEVISHAVWLYFRFPLSLCMVEEMVAARGNDVAMKPCGNGRVWSRDEVVRVDLEGCRVLCPGLADGLKGRSPSQLLKVLGEVVAHGGQRGRGSPLATLGARLERAVLCGRCRVELLP